LYDSEIFTKILRENLLDILTFFGIFRYFCRKLETLLPESRVISSVDAALSAVITKDLLGKRRTYGDNLARFRR
jgi:hypothetical protein